MHAWSRARWMLVVAVMALSSGCLSIGGKTYSDSPEMTSRVNSLEGRVGTLERALSGPPATVPAGAY